MNSFSYTLQYVTNTSARAWGWANVPGHPPVVGNGTLQTFIDTNALEIGIYRLKRVLLPERAVASETDFTRVGGNGSPATKPGFVCLPGFRISRPASHVHRDSSATSRLLTHYCRSALSAGVTPQPNRDIIGENSKMRSPRHIA
jgi:hypothetical protein